LAPIAFGLCKPHLAIYDEATMRILAMAIVKHDLGRSLLANVEGFQLFKGQGKVTMLWQEKMGYMHMLRKQQLKDSSCLKDFLEDTIPTWPSSSCNNDSWPGSDLVALAVFLASLGAAFLGWCGTLFVIKIPVPYPTAFVRFGIPASPKFKYETPNF
jgi:hypothetical protein